MSAVFSFRRPTLTECAVRVINSTSGAVLAQITKIEFRPSSMYGPWLREALIDVIHGSNRELARLAVRQPVLTPARPKLLADLYHSESLWNI